MIDLTKIKARCEAATGGEWGYSINIETEEPATLFAEIEGDEVDIACFEVWEATGYDEEMVGNAEFIAHARTDLPACIKEIERLRKRFGWIAEQGCEKIVENGQMKCSQTGRCITEWCYPCYARKALEAE